MTTEDLAVRQAVRLRADPSRVIAKLFVPGHGDIAGGRQVDDAVSHIVALDDADVSAALSELMARFGDRHRDLPAVFERHADRVEARVPSGSVLGHDRRQLLGATFTHEYSVEVASVCNPSLVQAPGQDDRADGSIEAVMSVRSIGEGHRSSIGFRRVVIDSAGQVAVAPRSPLAATGAVSASALHADDFRHLARHHASDVDATEWVLDQLADVFGPEDLAARLGELEAQSDMRPQVGNTIRRLRALAASSYRTEFHSTTELSERILHPVAPTELNGVEDARFVRFVDEDGVRYFATYTAYDGFDIAQQLLETTDFRTFDCAPLQGHAARNKGVALFPRRIDGKLVALSRPDGERNAIAFSDDIRYWQRSSPLVLRPGLWMAIQAGNCGSPIETEAGWVVLTHGVGPMRTYTIRACLLDLNDPTQIIGELPRPLLSPQPEERDGYVPNVVYSCGALLHAGHLVIPFGISDDSIGFATVPMDTVLGEMEMR